jgi:hypothetical protein
MTAQAAATDGDCSGMVNGKTTKLCSLLDFASTCYYFAEALTDSFEAAGLNAPPIGLVSTAVGGSMLEEWVPNATTARCKGASVGANNQKLWDENVLPYLPMTMKGWIWYQVTSFSY